MKRWSPEQVRLTSAALDCQRDLRALLPGLDQAIRENHSDSGLLERIRGIVSRHADSLRLALKGRQYQPRQSRSGPAWAIAGAAEGVRYLPKVPLRPRA